MRYLIFIICLIPTIAMANKWKPDNYMNSGKSKGAYLKAAPHLDVQTKALKKSSSKKKTSQNLKTENNLESEKFGGPVG
jgi:hypothetical protein